MVTPAGSVRGCNIVDCGSAAIYFAPHNNWDAFIDATYNWWGAFDYSGIESLVVHIADSSHLGTVDFTPFLAEEIDFNEDGACCLADESCMVLEQLYCPSAGGTHRGAGSVCPGDNDGDGVDDLCGRCCLGRVGDANGQAGDEPTIGDVGAVIDAKFISGTCGGVIPCLAEADVNQSGGPDPNCTDITISDISILIDYLFISGPENATLPDCL